MNAMRGALLLVCVIACRADMTSPAPLPVSAWGDSMTFGTGAPGGESYPDDLSALLGRPVRNGGVPGESSAQILARIEADTTHRQAVTILWMGTNRAETSPGDDTTQVIAAVTAAVQTLGPNAHYLILAVHNRPYESRGQGSYDRLMALNASFGKRFPGHYVDVRAFLATQYDSTSAQDRADYAADVPPASLRFDTVHLNAKGYRLVAEKVAEEITARGW